MLSLPYWSCHAGFCHAVCWSLVGFCHASLVLVSLCKSCTDLSCFSYRLLVQILSCWSCWIGLVILIVLSCKSFTGLFVQVLYRSVLLFKLSSCAHLVMLVLSDRSCHFDSFVMQVFHWSLCAGLVQSCLVFHTLFLYRSCHAGLVG